jgi:hypothetical protein
MCVNKGTQCDPIPKIQHSYENLWWYNAIIIMKIMIVIVVDNRFLPLHLKISYNQIHWYECQIINTISWIDIVLSQNGILNSKYKKVNSLTTIKIITNTSARVFKM